MTQDATISDETEPSKSDVDDEVAEVLNDLIDHVSLWGDPSTMDVEFFSLDYRKAPSMASASSASGSEFGDLSDSELPFVESDEDSEKEFEKLQLLSCEMRQKTFLREHPDGVPQQKRIKEEIRINKKDLEHDYDNLPALENLTIHCAESIPLEPVGHVTAVVDCLVVIKSDSGVALDFDSVLFDKDRNSIGVVYDLFGPVRSPFYSVRFNTKEEAAAKMCVGMQVYYAPTAEQYTRTVIDNPEAGKILSDDVSSEDEPVFSDDEKEKEYLKQKAAATNRPENPSQRRAQKRRVQFSESTAERGRGSDRGHRGRGSGGSWNWHSEKRGCLGGRGRGPLRGLGRGKSRMTSQTSEANSGNPYAEYGCYGPLEFVDTRQL
ncbi:unnamed protein product [Haemonchus placei]|uniref:H/ACA ribonucleoprotein complex non-core subunit NAF1 n=1 Tax=Haemonchus placei TaxID=6290 RepID=A0A0N4WBR5_HAEPC|nr:unnamed protein product [Haemonchus placei]